MLLVAVASGGNITNGALACEQLIFQLLRYEIPDAGPLILSLVYESQRVYRDRLVDRQSKKQFD